MKQYIAIIIIVVCLAGAGVFAYFTFFSGGSSSTGTALTGSSPIKALGGVSGDAGGSAQTSEILPLGSSLNFDPVQKFNKDERIYQYPTVNQSEIGQDLGTVIKQ